MSIKSSKVHFDVKGGVPNESIRFWFNYEFVELDVEVAYQVLKDNLEPLKTKSTGKYVDYTTFLTTLKEYYFSGIVNIDVYESVSLDYICNIIKDTYGDFQERDIETNIEFN